MDHDLVMLIDRDGDMQKIFTTLMDSRGIPSLIVSDPRDAIRVAKACHPSVIVTELFQRTEHGWITIERLRADPVTRGIPVVVLSASVFSEDRNAARASGADVFLAKPIDLSSLMRVIEEHLTGRKPN
jgi:two-component system cell cycle response regulator DivK